MSTMKIETFVFFDIETTGLPQFEKNRTKITELTFIAVTREDIWASEPQSLCMNKLSLLFNPERKIQDKASEITGLKNSNLNNQPVFKNRIHTINTFLKELKWPVCLVAHNGNRFDFKILRAEYCDVGQDLPDNLLCIDSLSYFRQISKDKNNCYNNETHLSPKKDINPKINIISAVNVDNLLTDDEDDWPPLNTSAEEWEEIDKLTDSFSKLSSDENTPNKSNTKKECYQLTELYKRIFKKEPITSHRAEADCIMLLECVSRTKDLFLPWADKNCKFISKITPFIRR